MGDVVQVKVMEIDLDRRRISLSMKSAAETLGVDVEVKPLAEDAPEADAAVEDAPEADASAEDAPVEDAPTEDAPVEE